jgi:hypothetical protein
MRKLLLLFLFYPVLLVSQSIPVIYAEGGVDWSEWKEDLTDDTLWATAISNFFNTRSSSSLENQGSSSYEVSNLNDWDPTTCWVEGSSDYGIGEYFIIFPKDDFDAGLAGDIFFDIPNRIYNGYQKSYYFWINNSRVKKFKIYLDNEAICYLILQDKMGGQFFDLPINSVHPLHQDFKWQEIKFEIVEVYKGNKWSDVAITEIHRVQH